MEKSRPGFLGLTIALPQIHICLCDFNPCTSKIFYLCICLATFIIYNMPHKLTIKLIQHGRQSNKLTGTLRQNNPAFLCEKVIKHCDPIIATMYNKVEHNGIK